MIYDLVDHRKIEFRKKDSGFGLSFFLKVNADNDNMTITHQQPIISHQWPEHVYPKITYSKAVFMGDDANPGIS